MQKERKRENGQIHQRSNARNTASVRQASQLSNGMKVQAILFLQTQTIMQMISVVIW